MCEYCEEVTSLIHGDIAGADGAFVRYDSTRLKGNVAIVDDDGEFVYE